MSTEIGYIKQKIESFYCLDIGFVDDFISAKEQTFNGRDIIMCEFKERKRAYNMNSIVFIDFSKEEEN